MNIKLENVYRQIPRSTCEAECGECCGILFPSLAELRNIKEWCEKHSVKYKDFHMNVGMDCPYLSEKKECTIYSVRPFLCRILGVSTDLPCPMGKCTPSKILNHPQSSALYTAIYLRGKEKSRTEKHRKVIQKILFETIA